MDKLANNNKIEVNNLDIQQAFEATLHSGDSQWQLSDSAGLDLSHSAQPDVNKAISSQNQGRGR